MTLLKPTLVQCDFDGTLTVGDISFLILDEFTGHDWRQLFQQYMRGEISVNRFNSEAFSKVKASRGTLDDFVRRKAVIRPGFSELLQACQKRGFHFVIVSNGMAFYIETILKMLGQDHIEFKAAQALFNHDGIDAWYAGPDGKLLENGFKEAYTRYFLGQGYRVIYIGNGASDLAPARMCQHIFAIDNLLSECQAAGIKYTPFNDLHDVAHGIMALT
jgi:2-hydroxy-3-keto-5-methylthiopentenyl-1-phosphate phosphatase